jgi:hypothetical protein
MHQIEALHRGGCRRRQANRTGVINQDIDAAEGLYGLIDSGVDLRLLADIADTGQGPAASPLDFRSGGIDGALQLGVRLGRLGRDDDVRPVARSSQRNCQADPAAGAGDKQGLAGKRARCHMGRTLTQPLPVGVCKF